MAAEPAAAGNGANAPGAGDVKAVSTQTAASTSATAVSVSVPAVRRAHSRATRRRVAGFIRSIFPAHPGTGTAHHTAAVRDAMLRYVDAGDDDARACAAIDPALLARRPCPAATLFAALAGPLQRGHLPSADAACALDVCVAFGFTPSALNAPIYALSSEPPLVYAALCSSALVHALLDLPPAAGLQLSARGDAYPNALCAACISGKADVPLIERLCARIDADPHCAPGAIAWAAHPFRADAWLHRLLSLCQFGSVSDAEHGAAYVRVLLSYAHPDGSGVYPRQRDDRNGAPAPPQRLDDFVAQQQRVGFRANAVASEHVQVLRNLAHRFRAAAAAMDAYFAGLVPALHTALNAHSGVAVPRELLGLIADFVLVHPPADVKAAP